MNVFVAGASGAIGRPLVMELIRQGHAVTGISRSAARLEHLASLGATILAVDVFDAASVEHALRDSQAEAVIDELTSLPRTPAEIHNALPGDYKVRIEGGGNLHRAAKAAGVRRYVQQSSGFFLKAGAGFATESDSLAVDACGDIAVSARMYRQIEERLFLQLLRKAWLCDMDFSMGREPGTTPTARLRTRFAADSFRLWEMAAGCGRLFTSKTPLRPRLRLLQLNQVFTTWSMTTLCRYAAGFQRLRAG